MTTEELNKLLDICLNNIDYNYLFNSLTAYAGTRIASFQDDLLIHFGAREMTPELAEGFKQLRRERKLSLVAAGSGSTVEECNGWVIEGNNEVFVAVDRVF